MCEVASAYNLSGYVQNTLEYPVYQARVDFNGSHVFTDVNGYYNFSNINYGNYTFLCRYIAASIGGGHFANYTKNISISGDTILNVTIQEKGYVVPVTPGFEGIGLISILGILFVIGRKK